MHSHKLQIPSCASKIRRLFELNRQYVTIALVSTGNIFAAIFTSNRFLSITVRFNDLQIIVGTVNGRSHVEH